MRKLGNEEYDEQAQRRAYEAFIPGFIKAARECGYALAIHGSMERDLDLIAVPWIEKPEIPEKLAFEIAVMCKGLLVGEIFSKQHRRLFHINLAWRGTENRNYIELSVTPTIAG